jgi:hypothetical protein
MKRHPLRPMLEAAVASGYLTPERAAKIELDSERFEEDERSTGNSTVTANQSNTIGDFHDIDLLKKRLKMLDPKDVDGLVSIARNVRDILNRLWEAGEPSVANHLGLYDRELGGAFHFFQGLDSSGDMSSRVVAMILLKRCGFFDSDSLGVSLDATSTSVLDFEKAQKAFQDEVPKHRKSLGDFSTTHSNSGEF